MNLVNIGQSKEHYIVIILTGIEQLRIIKLGILLCNLLYSCSVVMTIEQFAYSLSVSVASSNISY